MIKTNSYAAFDHQSNLTPYQFERRDLSPHDVLIEILYCGVCHSDIHASKNEWGGAVYPMVPGHEIVGRVIGKGSQVTKFQIADIAGVGVIVDSCRHCDSCKNHLEQYCENERSFTYNSYEQDKITVTQGGYSNFIVVDEAYTLKISPHLDLKRVAPLLCAGITVYSPLNHWGAKAGKNVAVIGLGGLGHMAVKFAKAMGANVTLFTTSSSKVQDAINLGVDTVVISTNKKDMQSFPQKLDLIISTISGQYDIHPYLNKLRLDGAFVNVGIPPNPIPLNLDSVITQRRSISGSAFGSILETQDMLDFSAKHNILADIELVPINKINEAFDRVVKNDVKYRFVIDMSSLSKPS